MTTLQKIWQEDDGVLSFEWVLLVTLLTVGVIGGMAAARDSIIDEWGDFAQAALALDQSFRVDFAPDIVIREFPARAGGDDSQFVDAMTNFNDDERSLLDGQDPQMD